MATITVYPNESPRLVVVETPATSVTVQEIINLLREWEHDPENMSYDYLISAAGKEDLGGGVTVGITATLQNAQLQFEGRTTALSTGLVADSNDTTGQLFTDESSGVDFISDGVAVGDTIFNSTTGSMATVLEVVSENILRHQVLSGGSRADWQIGDTAAVYPNIECNITGGNLVAVDGVGASISPVFPSPNTSVVRTSSSSATLQESAAIRYSSFNNGVTIDTISGASGTTYPQGTPSNPVDNIDDATTIANREGFLNIYIIGDFTFQSTDSLDDYNIIGNGRTKSNITFTGGTSTRATHFESATLTGQLSGSITIKDCRISSLSGVGCTTFDLYFQNCMFVGTMTARGDNVKSFHFIDCHSADVDSNVIIDLNGTVTDCMFNNFDGNIEIRNCTQAVNIYIYIRGEITLHSSVTAGSFYIIGEGDLTDNSTGTTIAASGYKSRTSISDAVLDEDITEHSQPSTVGRKLNRIKVNRV